MSNKIFSIVAGVCLAISGLLFGASEARACELDRPVKIAGMPYDSNLIIAEIVSTIIRDGYGCEAELQAGDVIGMIAAIYRGDIDLDLEIWENSAPVLWSKGVKEKKLTTLGGVTYSGASEGWWVPRYTKEKFPGLKSVTDLKKFKSKFKDPEEPSKGRILSCVPGWVCEVINANLIKAFGLSDDFNLITPGSDAALQALILSETRRKRDFVTYYWTPTPIIARADLVPLEMPEFNQKFHECNLDSECANPGASSFPKTIIKKGVTTAFVREAPVISAFIAKMTIEAKLLSEVLNWVSENKEEPKEGAKMFLKNNKKVWSTWVPADVAKKLSASL